MTMQAEYHGGFCCTLKEQETGAAMRTRSAAEAGDRTGLFAPTDLVGAALATCAMTVMGYAARHLEIDITGATVDAAVKMTPDHRNIAGVDLVFHMPAGEYSGKVKKQFESAVRSCPVHAALGAHIEQNFSFVWPDQPVA